MCLLFSQLAFAFFLPLKALAGPSFADERFGLSGSCKIAEEIGIGWSFNWGHGAAYPNNGEVNCNKAKDLNVLLTVGKLDNSETYDLTALENEYLKDAQDRQYYEEAKSVAFKYPASNHALASFLIVPKLALEIPKGHYEIANEPDWAPYVEPEDYAKYYRAFYYRIKKYDPEANVMPGGFVSILPEHKAHACNVWGKSLFCAGDYYVWIREFREQYKKLYGSYPPVDIWNIHPYIFPGQAWERAREQIVGFRDFLNSIGEGSKPLWLTEFGFLGYEGDFSGKRDYCQSIASALSQGQHACCLILDEQEEEWRQVAEDFMRPLLSWLKTTGYAQKWFWYYGGQNYPWFAQKTNLLGDVYYVNNECGFSFGNSLNPLGANLQQLAAAAKIANPGFESSTKYFYGWWFWAGGPGTDYTASVVSDEKHSGNRSLKVHVGSIAGQYGNAATINQTIETQFFSGKKVKFSAWVKTAGGGKAGIKIALTDENGIRNTNWAPSIVASREFLDWGKVETGWLIIPENTVKLEFVGIAVGKNADVWFDDMEVKVFCYDFDKNGSVGMGDILTILEKWGEYDNDLGKNIGLDTILNIIENWQKKC